MHESDNPAASPIDEERREAAALEQVNALLKQIAEGHRRRSAGEAERVHLRDEPCPVCPSPGHARDGDEEPPEGHTARYSAEVRRFATFRDLYQPD